MQTIFFLMSGQTQRQYFLKNIKSYKGVMKCFSVGLRAILDVNKHKSVLKKRKTIWKSFLVFQPFPEFCPGTPCTCYVCNVSKPWAFIQYILENVVQKTNSAQASGSCVHFISEQTLQIIWKITGTMIVSRWQRMPHLFILILMELGELQIIKKNLKILYIKKTKNICKVLIFHVFESSEITAVDSQSPWWKREIYI